jgi:hypothetical protein
MGSVKSIPVSDEDLARPHYIDLSVPTVSKNIEPDYSRPLVLYMPKDAARSSRGHQRLEVVRPDGISFRGITISGRLWWSRCVFALFDTDHCLVAACLQMLGVRYTIYTPQEVFSGQHPSKQEYEGGRLYTYAEVDSSRVTLTTARQGSSSPDYTVHGTESRRVIKRYGIIAATIEVVSEKRGVNSRRQVSLCPGIDPILLLCLTGIYDHLDYAMRQA